MYLEGRAVQSKEKLELHGPGMGQDMPLGRHIAAALMGARMSVFIKGQQKKKAQKVSHLESDVIVRCRSHAKLERARGDHMQK